MIKDVDSKYKPFTNGTLKISTMEPIVDGGEYTCLVKGSGSSMAKKALYVEIIRKFTNKFT
jgi:hypothetical protein